jgi:hypothetical protein
MICCRWFASVAVALATLAATTSAAVAAPTFAPAASATIRPGVMTHTPSGQCTANFVFYDVTNALYIGQAAHCSGTDGATATNGCSAGSLPLGTQVQVGGASRPGTMVYNSWLTMQAIGENNANTCQFNDFAIVKLDAADYGKVNPTIPFWGGPTGLTSTVPGFATVLSYGNSSLRGGLEQLKPKQGKSLGQAGGGWTHTVLTLTPGIPGDSGSAFIDAQGRAFGVLSTLQVLPLPGTNGVGDLSRELAYANQHAALGIALAAGTEPFRGPLLGL